MNYYAPQKVLFGDFHFHSPYSRAVSPSMSLEGLSVGARVKGLHLLGTGDFSHPLWFKELKSKLEEVEGQQGIFRLKAPPKDGEGILFTLTNEVATFFSTPQGVKKVHHIIHAPSLEVVAQLNEVFSKMGNLAADGRPMFARTSSAELVEKIFEVSNGFFAYPAHCLTPHFGALGSISGYDSLEECYGDQSKKIFALETGMSASPDMCWRMSNLDKYTLISNSDSHSNRPWRLGRECNAFAFSTEEVSYKKILDAVRNKNPAEFVFTVETFPEYGKYHYDGHRLCNFSCPPKRTRELNGKCPKCGRKLTIGVEYRVEQLADRPAGFVPPHAIPFKKILPLHELLASAHSTSLHSKKVEEEANKLLGNFGAELDVLLNVPLGELKKVVHEKIAELILLNREGNLQIEPGYDGEYGKPLLAEEFVLAAKKTRKNLEDKKDAVDSVGQKTLGEY